MRLRPILLALAPLYLGLPPAQARAEDALAQCIAASEQGLDLRKQEKLLEARKLLATCATTRCPDEIRITCEQRINEISGVLPAIAFEVKDASGNDVPDARITMDGAALATQLGGRATPIDPGPHTFTIEVAGQPRVEKKLVINEGDRDRHERVVVGAVVAPVAPVTLAAETPAPTAAPVGIGVTPVLTSVPEGAEATPSTGNNQRTVGLVLGGIGLGGVALGSIFGLVAISKWSSAKDDCGTGCGPDAPAQQERNDSKDAATVSTVAFAGGAALVAAGIAVYFLAPSTSKRSVGALSVTPSAGSGAAGLLLRGGF